MRLDVFGRRFELLKSDEVWAVFEFGEGKRRPVTDFSIPAELNESEALLFLEDLFHESATPDSPRIKVLE